MHVHSLGMKAKGLIGALVGGAVALVALLGACSHEIDSPEPATGKVAVRLALAGTPGSEGAERTVFPDISGIDEYALVFTSTSGGKGHSETVNPPASTANVTLEVGTYTLTVTARKGGADIAEGTKTGLVITSGGTTSESITLEPKTGTGVANGTFSYNVTVPAGASATLTITTSTGETVSGGTITLSVGANNSTMSLPPGEYRLAVSLTNTDGKTAGFTNQVVYSYSTLTSAFTRVFADEDFEKGPDPDPETGSLDLTIAFGQDPIPFNNTNDLSFEQGAETTFTLTVTGSEFSAINWYLDEEATAVATGASYTPANNLSVKKHLVTVTAVKNGKSYSEIVDFTVTAPAVPAGYIAIDSMATLAKIGVDNDYPLDGQYIQTADITISGAWTPIGTLDASGNPDDGAFSGTFDGNEFKIIPGSDIEVSYDFAIFNSMKGASIKDVHIGAGSITLMGEAYSLGGIGNTAVNTDFIDCSNAATLTGQSVGGICNYIMGGSIINCKNTGTITGSSQIGGICSSAYGDSSHTTVIQSCYNEGSIIGSSSGGIAGLVSSAAIIACYNTGAVTGAGKSNYAGGIAGTLGGAANNGTGYITACYNEGTVSSNETRQSGGKIYLGGINGRSLNGYVAVTACYNAGTVSYTGTGDEGNLYIGGIGGYYAENPTGTTKFAEITACYWKAEGNPANGIGAKRDAQNTTEAAAPASNTGTFKFADNAWPTTGASEGQSAEWGTGDGSGSGKYWKDLGSYNGSYPQLAWVK
ncbi:MAG: hypothetical protein LBL76_07940 [Treponema sp.]|jgi:hypothetical protein|nr:hypothetical protein [Treponema sp.]